MKRLLCFAISSVIILSSFKLNHSFAVKDYLSVPSVILNKSTYSLSWSSHPTETYYKHEYLTAGQKSDTYTNMVMIEAVVGEISLADVVKGKMAELDQRKATDPVTNYQIVQNKAKGEYLLDFVLSQSAAGKTSIAEWNAYRYVPLTDKNGKKGILLFSYSKRGYGDGVTDFLKTLKTARVADINTIANYTIPAITIKN